MHTESQNSSQKKEEPIQKIGWSYGREESWVVGVTLPLYAEYPPKVHFHKITSQQNIITTLKEVPQIVFTYLLYLSTSKGPSGALQRGQVCKNQLLYKICLSYNFPTASQLTFYDGPWIFVHHSNTNGFRLLSQTASVSSIER